MKIIFIFSTMTLLISCISPKQPPEKIKYSTAQIFLNNLKDSLKLEYGQALSERQKDNILEKYNNRLEEYLLERRIDSIRVTVDEIIIDNMTVTTRLHDKDIEFKYTLAFGYDSMPPKLLKAYNFMTGLKPGTDTTSSFSFTGAFRINKPDNKSVPIFRIFAFPIPLEFNGD